MVKKRLFRVFVYMLVALVLVDAAAFCGSGFSIGLPMMVPICSVTKDRSGILTLHRTTASGLKSVSLAI